MDLAQQLVQQLVQQLAQRDQRIVLAESCTGGLASSELAAIAGVSQYLCGSAVTYREDTKTRWLGVSEELLRKHTAVSEPVAIEMARGVLQRTPEASLAASITGHLGPAAPQGFDGVVFVGTAIRTANDKLRVTAERHQLQSQGRQQRQREAAQLVLKALLECSHHAPF